MVTRWSAVVGAGLMFASLVGGPALAIDIPIQIPGCPERTGTDRIDRDRDRGRPAPDSDYEQACGGGGGGGEAANPYAGVQLVAPAGGGGGGGGGGGTSRTTASNDAPAADTPAASGLVLGPATNQSPSVGGGGGGGGGRTRPAATPASVVTPQAAAPALVLGPPTNQSPAPSAGASTSGLGDFGFPSVGSDHGAPLPDLGGPFAWLLAAATGALLLWRRGVRD